MWPLFSAVAMFLLLITVLTVASIRQTGGHLIYALDDPYIHMAMAKNFSEHGVWGVTRYEFTSTSSSILWTLLLSLVYSAFGVNEITPFVLNIILSIALLWLLFSILKKHALPDALIFTALICATVMVPLHALVFAGMEHVLQSLAALSFMYLTATVLAGKENATIRLGMILLAACTVLIRFEGIFIIIVVGVFLLFRRRYSLAAMVTAAGLLPIFAFQLISVAHGWFLLPNSVLLRAGLLESTTSGSGPSGPLVLGERLVRFATESFRNIGVRPHIMAVLVSGIFLFFVRSGKITISRDAPRDFFFVVLGITFLHMQSIRAEQFFRYEAYLVCLGLAAFTLLLSDLIPPAGIRRWWKETPWSHRVTGILLVAILSYPLLHRGIASARMIPVATKNIYEQQYQMARFLGQFYSGKAVAANDVGAINFLADIRCLDLTGLASVEVSRMRRQGRYDTEEIDELTKARDARVAILYDHWFTREGAGGLPREWTKVGRWIIRDNVVCAGDTVSFYAVSVEEAPMLRENLHDFAPDLPKDVICLMIMELRGFPQSSKEKL